VIEVPTDQSTTGCQKGPMNIDPSFVARFQPSSITQAWASTFGLRRLTWQELFDRSQSSSSRSGLAMPLFYRQSLSC
jgi:hypothetical protein